MSVKRNLRIVAADDSAVIRHMLAMLFDSVAEHAESSQPKMELAAAVADGVSCVDTVRSLRPDLLLLDLEMPRMSGMEVLDILHAERPEMPIIMCSAYTARGAAATLDALARGAADYVTKPSGSKNPLAAMASLSAQLLPKIAALAARPAKPAQPLLAVPAEARRPLFRGAHHKPTDVVGIGVSTGGPAALELLLPSLPATFAAPVVIVQHMPKLFTGALAQRLNGLCALPVREALEGVELRPGAIWLAPGDSHLEVTNPPLGTPRLMLTQGPPLHHCRPAVDVLFRSLAKTFGDRALGVVLTGMGSDGVAGARELVRAGAAVLAQDEASSAVWGMPGRLVEEGLAAEVLPLSAMAAELMGRTRKDVSMQGPARRNEPRENGEMHYAMQ